MAAGLAVAAAGRWSELVRFAREYVKPSDAVAAVLLVAAAWTTKCASSQLTMTSLPHWSVTVCQRKRCSAESLLSLSRSHTN